MRFSHGLTMLQSVIGTSRPKFLLLTLVCVYLGAAVAWHLQGMIDPERVVLVLIGALLAHASVNLLNEYDDFRSGLDFNTLRTPFSGGSGILPAKPDAAPFTLAAGIATLVVTGMIGLYFVSLQGPALLPLGILGLALIVAYTPWVTRNPLLCLFAPGLGFGPFMVVGTSYVFTGSYSWSAWIASLIPFFLVSNLLLLNQFPDVEADQRVGRRHLPICIGRRRSAWVYAGVTCCAYLSIVGGVAADVLPVSGLLALPVALIAVAIIPGIRRNATDMEKLKPLLGWNLVVTLLTPLLLATGLFLA
jgi:1,4-dihydroxy-2-naphthoate octaprenyltransferase